MLDLLIAGASIVDGLGGPTVPGFVGVKSDRIAIVGGEGQSEPEAAQRITAMGHAISPGFIDVHNHSDLVPFVEPWMDSMLRQGVTTVVVGNCGTSAAPPAGAAEAAELMNVRPDQLDLSWQTFAQYLERLDACRPAINVAALVGHGALRRQAMGMERRAPTADELSEMRRLLAEGLDAGAVGMSTGLIYAPGIHASTDEIVEIAQELPRYGGVYASHIRGEGAPVFDAVAECIEIGRRTGAPSHISHLKVETSRAWGRAAELLALIDSERERGADVSADQYPYAAWESSLSSCLPAWASPEELPALRSDPATHERLRTAVQRGEEGWQCCADGLGWDRIVIVGHAGSDELTGRSIQQVAEDRGADPVDTVFDLLMADPNTSVIGHAMLEEDVRTILARDDVMVASDGLGISPDGPMAGFNVHPRYYGTFPRVLGRYVAEGVLPLETAVKKMTSLPADRFALGNRGRIHEGAVADLVVFDPASVTDRATFGAPHLYAEGILAVIVAGRVVWDGEPRERAGRVIRRSEWPYG